MDQKRIFLAIETPKNIKQKVTELTSGIKKRTSHVKWVVPENFHINLRFLGNVSEEKISKLIESLKDLRFDKFKLELKGVGAFPSKNYIKVLWLGVVSDTLSKLKNGVDARLTRIGFAKENREYVPHMTLARVKTASSKEQLLKFITENSDKELGNFEVENFYLYESRLSPKGPEYIELHKFELGK